MEELRNIVECRPTSRPVHPDSRAQNQNLHLRYNIIYIVAGVVFEGDKVLMIQEAKQSCRGKWYLPAGRMEPNETIAEAVKREVLEESGLNFEPEAVLFVECMSRSWIRITLAGTISGGSLKTTKEADSESLQAGWFTVEDLKKIHLRATDILPLIDKGRERINRHKFYGLPVEVGHVSVSLRLVVVYDSNGISVLTKSGGQGSTAFPIAELERNSIKSTLKACGYPGPYEVHGVLSLEHLGRPTGEQDGMCLSLILQASNKELTETSSCCWTEVESNVQERLRNSLKHCGTIHMS